MLSLFCLFVCGVRRRAEGCIYTTHRMTPGLIFNFSFSEMHDVWFWWWSSSFHWVCWFVGGRCCRIHHRNGNNLHHFDVITEPQGRVSHQLSKHQEVCGKKEAQSSVFNQLLSVWISDEILFWVFVNNIISFSKH